LILSPFFKGLALNINAKSLKIYQVSVRREAQIDEQTKEINNLKKECDDLKLRISSLENRIMEGDRRKQVRRQEDLGPPDGVEQRSGLERRKHVAMG
jgi:cell division protein FtsL